MNRIFRTIGAAALSLMLALSGQAMAQLRVAPGPAGAMVICTGTGPMRVLIGKDGAPMDTPHVCPECALAALSGTLTQSVLPKHLPRMSRLQARSEAAHAASRDAIRATARAPPLRA